MPFVQDLEAALTLSQDTRSGGDTAPETATLSSQPTVGGGTVTATATTSNKMVTSCSQQIHLLKSNHLILIVSLLIWTLMCGAGVALCIVFEKETDRVLRDQASAVAVETGAWFSDQLDRAILPLFSLAQFATELQKFHSLPASIGAAGEPGSLPFLTTGSFHRNVTGVCDEPALVKRFTKIASTIKKRANMEGVLVNLQLAPHGVICLLHPMNNTEDFSDGVFLDNSGVWGLDLLNDPAMKFIAEASVPRDEVVIAGPRRLTQCKDQSCDATVEQAFIARLPIEVEDHDISVHGQAYKRWGFATALINWAKLVERSGVHETFEQRQLEFQLTRKDFKFNIETDAYDEEVVVLAETSNYGTKRNRYVTTCLQTTNNEWEMTVGYAGDQAAWKPWVIASVALLSFCIASLVYIVLTQKQRHTAILGQTAAQEGKVEVERNMTSYFAHELRNPLGAIDCALSALPDDLPDSTKELVRGMHLCTTFMSTIMNNLLDFRKMEEGKMLLHPQPLSLNELLMNVHRMLLPSVKPGVDLVVDRKTPVGKDWVLGDNHRLQQVLTNITTNAIKYTVSGSIALSFKIEHDQVRFECTDTGPGIPRNEQDKLFERYVQRGGAPGTGLGLAIAKHIVALMGGSIQFDSDPTQRPGTACIVLVPLPSCPSIACESSKPTDKVKPIEKSLSILIVDDIRMNRQMLGRRIKRHILPNAEITEASTGEEALQLCETETFDLVIMDQYMEEAGGVLLGSDTVIAMRRMRKDSIIIGCSGNEMNASFMAAGTDWVWLKPVPSNETIVHQIRVALEKKENR